MKKKSTDISYRARQRENLWRTVAVELRELTENYFFAIKNSPLSSRSLEQSSMSFAGKVHIVHVRFRRMMLITHTSSCCKVDE